MLPTQRILYVDDDALCRRSFAREMRQSGFIVDVAESGEEALELAQRYPYAVLAADLHMPNVDGVRLVSELRRRAQGPTCMLVTGAGDHTLSGLDLPALGIRHVARKPWRPEVLAAQLKAALGEHASSIRPPGGPLCNQEATLKVVVLDADSGRGHKLEQLLHRSARVRFSVEQLPQLGAALERLEHSPVDVVLVSLDDPTESSETIARLLGSQPSAPIIAVSNTDDDSLSVAAVQAGAQDFMLQSELEPNLLVRSVQHAIERKRAEDRLAHIAHHDQLTGLANRKLLGERVQQAIARAQRKHAQVAVFFLDLDRFKLVNDTLGHDAGDQLLQHVAARLLGSVRTTDTVARLGGDEFAIVLEDLDRNEEATLLAGRVLNSFATPFRLNGGEVVTTTSIGIAMFPHNGEHADDLLKCADSAMYRAKQTGRDNYQFFSKELHAQAVKQIELESCLRDAVENEDFIVHYQPQLDARTLRPVAMEALVRWRHPSGQLLRPQAFMSILEETGLIVPLGEWVLRQACAQVKAWNASSRFKLRAAVNISARQFEAPGFVDSVTHSLVDHNLSGRDLELEITETVLMRDTERTRDSFEQLRQLGVRIAIDDFGTGYSSLAYLKTFPIDALKIDRSFLQGVAGDESNSSTLASAVIALGRSLCLDVVAEGVETQQQLEFLAHHQCGYLQGYLLGQPQNAARTTWWLQSVAQNDGRIHVASSDSSSR